MVKNANACNFPPQCQYHQNIMSQHAALQHEKSIQNLVTQRSTTAMLFQQHKTPKAVVLACCKGNSEARQGNNLKNAWHCNVFFCFFRMHSRPSFFLWHSDMHCIFLENHAKVTHFRRSQRRRIELLSTLRIPTLSGKQVLVEKMCMKKQ